MRSCPYDRRYHMCQRLLLTRIYGILQGWVSRDVSKQGHFFLTTCYTRVWVMVTPYGWSETCQKTACPPNPKTDLTSVLGLIASYSVRRNDPGHHECYTFARYL